MIDEGNELKNCDPKYVIINFCVNWKLNHYDINVFVFLALFQKFSVPCVNMFL